MTIYTVTVNITACYTLDTGSSNYDYILMDDEGNPLPDTAESIRQIEEGRTVKSIKLEGNGFHIRRQDARVEHVEQAPTYRRPAATAGSGTSNTSTTGSPSTPATPISPSAASQH